MTAEDHISPNTVDDCTVEADGRFQSLEQPWDIFQGNSQIISQATLTTLREV